MRFVAMVLTRKENQESKTIIYLEKDNTLDALKSIYKFEIPMFSNKRRGYWFANYSQAGLVDLNNNVSIDIQTEERYFKSLENNRV
jgi:hypothetical protein